MADDILTESIPIKENPVWTTINKPGLGVEVDNSKLNFYHKKFVNEGEFLPYGEKFK
jgi:L-alanine-DL-glutamate epimerase-like enolase superfamily enzyme